MRRDRTAGREISAGRSQSCRSTPGQERAEQQDRTSQPADKRRVRTIGRDPLTSYPQGRRAGALNLRTQAAQDLREDLDVADAGDVLEHTRLVGEQARRHQR
jgi:hypothetical protein